ncbi:hypothetical protein CHUAL_012733 [Chamberlinius hualienensis]
MAEDKSTRPSTTGHLHRQLWAEDDSPAFKEFLANSEQVNMSEYLDPSITITSHRIYKGFTFTDTMGRGAVEAKNRIKINENDIVLAATIKTGSTWAQEILYNLTHLDEIDVPSTVSVDLRVPLLELPECGLETINDMPSPRALKTHLPYDLLPLGTCNKKYKIIYVIRNPKDTAVSLYHFYQMMPAAQFNGTLKDFLNVFFNGKYLASPYPEHVLSYWNNRHLPNILIVTYENMQKDIVKEIRRMANFIGTDDKCAEKVATKCCFQQMASNPNTHHQQWQDYQNMTNSKDFTFMRKGKVGDWKNKFDEETKTKFDEWIEEKFGAAAPMAEDKSTRPCATNNLHLQFWAEKDSPALQEFLANSEQINMSEYLNPSISITSHRTYKGYTFPDTMGRGAVEAKNRIKMNENDILLAATVKTGSTWAQEILYNLTHLDEIDVLSTVSVDFRIPLLELPECGLETINDMPSPRALKTHLPYDLLPLGTCNKTYKIIYVMRNPKDTAVSLFHFYRMIPSFQFNGALSDFLNVFFNGKYLASPYPKHVLSYWNNRHLPNILIVTYENMQRVI